MKVLAFILSLILGGIIWGVIFCIVFSVCLFIMNFNPGILIYIGLLLVLFKIIEILYGYFVKILLAKQNKDKTNEKTPE